MQYESIATILQEIIGGFHVILGPKSTIFSISSGKKDLNSSVLDAVSCTLCVHWYKRVTTILSGLQYNTAQGHN